MKELTEEIKEKVRIYVGSDCSELSPEGFWFYYNQMQNHLDLCDAKRYANLNTVMGYDIGITIFQMIDSLLWCCDRDVMQIKGTKEDKELIMRIYSKLELGEPDFSKWQDFSEARDNGTYQFKYFISEKQSVPVVHGNEVVVRVENGEYVHIWFSLNEPDEDEDWLNAFVEYQVYDKAKTKTNLYGEFGYHSDEMFIDDIIRSNISEVLEYIYYKTMAYGIVCETLEEFYK